MKLVHVSCCVCDADDATPLGVGRDFEYETTQDAFLAVRCNRCGLIYLNPRPAIEELGRIYPPSYHAFGFTPSRFGFVYRVRRRLEAGRLLRLCCGLPADAHILDVGCGDGFHLDLLQQFGSPAYRLEGVDADPRAVAAARQKGLQVHCGSLEELALDPGRFDLVLLIQTIEHVEDPPGLLRAILRTLRPNGKLVIVTDNSASLDRTLFGAQYWGGYHFPRHWNLFDKTTIKKLATRTGFAVDWVSTQVSPVNWVYSLRNALVDLKAPSWLYERFSLRSPVSLGVFTAVNACEQLFGSGALLHAELRRPQSDA